MMIPKSQILTKKRPLLTGIDGSESSVVVETTSLVSESILQVVVVENIRGHLLDIRREYKLHLAESDRSGKLKLEKRYQDVACGP